MVLLSGKYLDKLTSWLTAKQTRATKCPTDWCVNLPSIILAVIQDESV